MSAHALLHRYEATPEKSLYAVTATSAEQEEGVCKRIQLELLLYNCCQSIYSSPQVSIAAGYEGVVWMKAVQHDFSPLSILSMKVAEALS